MTSPASSSSRARHSSAGRPSSTRLSMVNSFRWLAPLRVAAEAGADLEDPERPAPDAAQPPHERVEVRRQHWPQAAPVVEPEDLLAQRVAVLDAHLHERVGADDERRDHLTKPGAGERRAEVRLELHEPGHPPAVAQLLQAPPALAHELRPRACLKAASRAAASVKAASDERRVCAQLAQALCLRRGEGVRRRWPRRAHRRSLSTDAAGVGPRQGRCAR